MTIGYIGLGKMGKNMVLHMLEQGEHVIAWNRSPDPVREVVAAGAVGAASLEDLVSNLREIATTENQHSIVVWLMLRAGEATDEILAKLTPLLQPGDLVIDGGNSFYKDTIRRNTQLQEHGISFMDVGVSGGPSGARNGACLMIGGSSADFAKMTPLFIHLSSPDAYAHLGPTGSGHFTKMVHNGIEYGMMQAIAEGAAILKKSDFNLNMPEVFRIYNNRSVIESRLVGWTQEILEENPELEGVDSVIGMLGEGEWTVDAAHELGVSAPIIEGSVDVRKQSQTEPENFRNKIVTALRIKFGGPRTKTS